MNSVPVTIAWESPSRQCQPISGGDLIWSVAIVWLAGFFWMANVVTAGVGCTGSVERLPSPEAGSPTTTQPVIPEIETDPELPLCSKREKSFFDGGFVSVPLPCNPYYEYRGDPQP